VNAFAKQVAAMDVPPRGVLRFHDVRCSFQEAGGRVLCSGVMVKPDGHRLPRTSVLFRAPERRRSRLLVPICDQGGYGVSPKLNIFCAQ
jgi:hypothetical protein